MQNCTFLVLLRPIFVEKMKTAPPKEVGCRSCEVDVVIRPEKAFEYPLPAEKSVSISVKTFFFLFWRYLFLAEKAFEFRVWPKNPSQFRWRPFFLYHLFLGWKSVWISEFSEKFRLNFRINRVVLIQERWKFGSRSFAVFSLFQKSPPFFKSWLRAWLQYCSPRRICTS